MQSPSITDFAVASLVKKVDDSTYLAHIPDQWQQGRGAFGGLVIAAMLRATQACEPDAERSLRTVSGSLAGPVMVGDALIRVRELRRGNGASTFVATLEQNDEALVQIIAVYAKTRVSDRDWNTFSMPPIDSYDRAVEVPVRPPVGPVFSQHYVYRSIGARPMSGSPSASAEGWIQTRVPLTQIGGPEIAAYADTWWPAAFARETAPRPMATISYSLQITADLSKLDPTAPLLRAIARTFRMMASYTKCASFGRRTASSSRSIRRRLSS